MAIQSSRIGRHGPDPGGHPTIDEGTDDDTKNQPDRRCRPHQGTVLSGRSAEHPAVGDREKEEIAAQRPMYRS